MLKGLSKIKIIFLYNLKLNIYFFILVNKPLVLAFKQADSHAEYPCVKFKYRFKFSRTPKYSNSNKVQGKIKNNLL
ncbi:hypothetical protein DOM21_02560 [Bacteriovorax stolpii]|nr:hypothetical protein DOM21_02560 [Bacteriovorax stolpii]